MTPENSSQTEETLMTTLDDALIPPRPAAKFWDRIADRYAAMPVADQAAYQEKLRITRKYFRPDMQVLEFGCGTGSTALAHAPYVKNILAIDISARMIEIARAKAAAQGGANVTFQRATLDDLTVPHGGFDAVMGHSILHLVENRDRAIAQVYDLLKPGGVFVSSTVCLGDSLAFFKLLAPIGRWTGLLPLLRVFTRNELVESLERAGFRIREQLQPGKRRVRAVFIVAEKPDPESADASN